MTTTLRELLTLEPLEINLFRGRSPKFEGYKRIYGGQVIAQALMAAYGTVEERICHSLHCYFIRPGDITIPCLLFAFFGLHLVSFMVLQGELNKHWDSHRLPQG